jgi:Domain of unknown function (DUF4114)/PEP-CTERM motif
MDLGSDCKKSFPLSDFLTAKENSSDQLLENRILHWHELRSMIVCLFLKGKTMKNLKLSLFASMALVGASWGTVIGISSEQSLQSILNERTIGGTSSINVNTDQVDPDAYWGITASTVSSSTMIIEIAGNAGTNIMGIYDLANPANKVVLFNGAATTGNSVSLKITGGNHFKSVDLDAVVVLGEADFASSTFGYYLQSGSTIYYSDMSLNGGVDQMVSYMGKGDQFSVGNNGIYSEWGANEYVLAWEDKDLSGDRDFNDMVVMVESVKPVPEPTTMGLMGLGLLGIFTVARRRYRK